MKIKWVCKECSTVNICEEGERTVCFVCKKERTDERLLSISEAELKTTRRDEILSESSDEGFFAKLYKKTKEYFAAIFHVTHEGSRSTAEGIVDWKISRSNPTSREAYVKAEPVYAVVESEDEIESREETRSDREHVSASEDSRLLIDGPWPEHRAKYDTEKLVSVKCVKIVREEMDGDKGYRLTFESGETRHLTLVTCNLLGFTKPL